MATGMKQLATFYQHSGHRKRGMVACYLLSPFHSETLDQGMALIVRAGFVPLVQPSGK